MVYDAEAVARVQASAYNAHDLETVINQFTASAKVLRDGHLIGEGKAGVRHGLETEWHDGGYVQVRQLDGEPVLAECVGNPEHPVVEGVIRLHHTGDFVDELRIDHDAKLLAPLQ